MEFGRVDDAAALVGRADVVLRRWMIDMTLTGLGFIPRALSVAIDDHHKPTQARRLVRR